MLMGKRRVQQLEVVVLVQLDNCIRCWSRLAVGAAVGPGLLEVLVLV